MKNIKLFLIIISLGALGACVSDSLPQQKPNRAEVQAECVKHYSNNSNELTHAGKIKACMRARGAL